jgi:hypothetical protein
MDEIHSLVSLKKSIQNYSKILTGEVYPIVFSGEYTGDNIVISSDITPEMMDVTVGLALQEIATRHYNTTGDLLDNDLTWRRYWYTFPNSSMPEFGSHKKFIERLARYIEGERVFQLIKQTAPGYSVYREKMWEFYNPYPQVRENLEKYYQNKSPLSYLYRLIHRKHTTSSWDLLPGLKEACKELDDIINDSDFTAKWSGTHDSIGNAYYIYSIIREYMGDIELNQIDVDNSVSMTQYLDGEVEKKEIPTQQTEMISQISESGIDYSKFNDDDIEKLRNIDVNVIDVKLSPSNVNEFFKPYHHKNKKPIQKGIRLGKKLVKKMLVRNNETTIKQTYKQKGLLDTKRLPFYSEDERLFYMKEVITSTKYKIHLSVDISGSMGGVKFEEVISMMVGLVYCSTKIKGFELEVTLRSSSGVGGKTELCYLHRIFDSKTTKWSSFVEITKNIVPFGGTPDGVLLKYLSKELKPNDHLFILSDGAPSSSAYGDKAYAEYTSRVVKSLIKDGINVDSYFIGNGIEAHHYIKAFKEIYGKVGHIIGVKSTNKVVKKIADILV